MAKFSTLLTAYTQQLFCTFEEIYVYAEQLLRRPIQTAEFGNGALWENIKEEMRKQGDVDKIKQFIRKADDVQI